MFFYFIDYKRPQPIKIAQLLGQSENLKTIQKDSGKYIYLLVIFNFFYINN